LIALIVSVPAAAQAQSPGAVVPPATPAPSWSGRVSVATYVFPDDENYVQPTLAADRGALHLESRYNYEDRRSFSGFIGWNVALGKTVKFELTPMFGGVVGETAGVIPALELDLAWRRLELYVEGEYVFDAGRPSNRFLYNWSEMSVWAAAWLRAGAATQRTRAHRAPRDIQRGLFVAVTVSKIEGVVYLFNPASDDAYVVASITVAF
jgi:hypothetical protein